MRIKEKISDIALKIISYSFYSAASANFSINNAFSNGNVFDYFAICQGEPLNLMNGEQQLAIPLWKYQYFYGYIIYYVIKKFQYIFIISTFIYILVKHQGKNLRHFKCYRCHYWCLLFSELSKKKKIDNKKYLLVAGIIILASVFMYFFRLMSNYIEIGKVDNVLDGFKLFFHQIGYYAVDRGNVPNIAIMPKIIDSWDSDIGYLCGSSFLTFIFSFVNIGIPHTKFMTSVMIKNTWFSQVEGGFLPPTGVGEMYANFGPVGVFIGMLLFGIFIALLYKYMLKKGNFFVTLVSIKIIVLFIMIYPKS